MTCEQVERDEIPEKYLTSRLSSQEQELFEEHYFTCSKCFQTLDTYRALQAELSDAASTIRAESSPRAGISPWVWVAGAAAAACLGAVLVWPLFTARELPRSTPVAAAPEAEIPPTHRAANPSSPFALAPSLIELARVEPPPYVVSTLRDAPSEATKHFRTAMRRYAKGDFAATLFELRAAAKLDPKAAEIQFFLGVAYLLTEQTDKSIEHFRTTLALGDTPYMEDAHFYLAKALLRQGHTNEAKRELRKARELEGDLAAQAGELLVQLDSLSTTPR